MYDSNTGIVGSFIWYDWPSRQYKTLYSFFFKHFTGFNIGHWIPIHIYENLEQ